MITVEDPVPLRVCTCDPGFQCVNEYIEACNEGFADSDRNPLTACQQCERGTYYNNITTLCTGCPVRNLVCI